MVHQIVQICTTIKKQKRYFVSQRKWPVLEMIIIRIYLPPRVHAPSSSVPSLRK